MITREGSFCQHDHGERFDCDGKKVSKQTDLCAICYPLSRLFIGALGYIDIYSAFVREVQVAANENQTKLSILVEDEVVTEHAEVAWSYPVEHIFPLSTCLFIGLTVPCPRNPRLLLQNVYGDSYTEPKMLCHSQTGKWIKTV